MITIDLDKLSVKPGWRVLDVGCGSGRHCCALSRFKGVEVVGTDLVYEELTKACERVALERSFGTLKARYCEFAVSDICFLPFKDGFFDLVICSEVLEHVLDPGEAVSELSRVLRPGGDLVISVPRTLPEKICWALSRSYGASSGGHLRIYRREELQLLVEGKGLSHWATHFAHGLHSPYWWLRCVVGLDNENSRLVKLYHDLLLWDIMKKPKITRVLDALLTPVMGKSLVMYFRKGEDVCS
ncbi:MAG: SAM-dependent methyltransferase [Deltaproteobacteria bacterium]|nr:class I SAM-dependent methyltransferase [Deltaproteobacteria bacterium]MBW2083758.1 class I SAM-dependent methyltransferase [Deltaproteobacteria bacterium]RLB86590.1 MAG: SAM-dependent methyltransferase [Deltaproteobacteria bacterium]HDM10688.1 class I SAM-dependent methyltransferase [Desulfobacteraceae bacterium]